MKADGWEELYIAAAIETDIEKLAKRIKPRERRLTPEYTDCSLKMGDRPPTDCYLRCTHWAESVKKNWKVATRRVAILENYATSCVIRLHTRITECQNGYQSRAN